MSDEGTNNEEREEFEAYAEQPILSTIVDQGTSAPTRIEERSKQRVETEESSASELLSLLKEMKA